MIIGQHSGNGSAQSFQRSIHHILAVGFVLIGGGRGQVSGTFQKPEVEGCEYQDDSYIHRQPFPEVILKKQEIYSDHNGYQEQYVKHDSRLASHLNPLQSFGRGFIVFGSASSLDSNRVRKTFRALGRPLLAKRLTGEIEKVHVGTGPLPPASQPKCTFVTAITEIQLRIKCRRRLT